MNRGVRHKRSRTVGMHLASKRGGPVRVLVVDDSSSVRKALAKGISRAPDIVVVDTAENAYEAKKKLIALRPDLLTLDVEMPGKDGITFLREIMKEYPVPVIVVSSLTPKHSKLAIDALMAGALEVVPKPSPSPDAFERLTQILTQKIRVLARLSPRTNSLMKTDDLSLIQSVKSAVRPTADPIKAVEEYVIAIGASTGGTEAIKTVLSMWPIKMPPILVVQHLPETFTRAFAVALNDSCAIRVEEAEDGMALEPGFAIVAKGDHHLLLSREAGIYRVRLKKGPRVHFQRPSVDVLFHSIARYPELKAIGILLTGMGADGAEGLLSMKKAGACTIAQDKDTSVVYGMPREAARLQAANMVLPLEEIAPRILSILRGWNADRR